jgi:hypothetical protein
VNCFLRIVAAFLLTQALGSLAEAHPGHGTPGPTHYLTSLDHAVTIGLFVLGVVTVLLAARRVVRNKTIA